MATALQSKTVIYEPSPCLVALSMGIGVGVSLDKSIKRSEEKRRWPETFEPVYGPDNTPSAVPWELWELDKKFFGALSRWALPDHPETSLGRVLQNI
ncbi:hypothetical protein BDZ94DRAFT_1311456 [Collybia nuda]|uniref:Uncharacterized protein n=1 Tax=Collybia nuda TaxID=64659 RepID=A0A9P5Y163_9AGAR|nr:hypothetical protein BDZ94DRAFT_1311456 [Collybia nuda]